MAMTAYMKVEGSTQGEMQGDCQQQGRENLILVYGVDHALEIPRDTHTGLPTGQRIHLPMTITKHKEQSSPKLFQACASGEQCTVTLDHYRITPAGKEEKYFTVKLENAIIVSMREYTPMTFLPDNKPYLDMEEVMFTYSKITWTYVPSGVESDDSWLTPKA
jgi:type VI secretion system secreted protein Hcp